jgi:membrane protein
MRVLRNIIRRFLRPIFIILRNTIQGFLSDKVSRMGASIAYYTIFSLPAFIIIVIALVGFFLGEAAVEGRIYSALVGFVGEQPAVQIQNAVQNIGSHSTNWWMTLLGFGFLVFIATNIFYAMQETLNKIFGVEEVPQKVKLIQVLINRVLSFGMILSIGALLILSVIINGLLFAMTKYVQTNKIWMHEHLPKKLGPAITYLSDNFLVAVNLGFSIALITIFFVLLYKILPAVKLRWRFIWAGSLFAAVLFWIGQILIAYYLQSAGVINAYGAAGSLIALLIWVYYSALLIFIGAEFIKSYCQFRGVVIKPKGFAKMLQKGKKDWAKKMRKKDEQGNVVDVYVSVLN